MRGCACVTVDIERFLRFCNLPCFCWTSKASRPYLLTTLAFLRVAFGLQTNPSSFLISEIRSPLNLFSSDLSRIENLLRRSCSSFDGSSSRCAVILFPFLFRSILTEHRERFAMNGESRERFKIFQTFIPHFEPPTPFEILCALSKKIFSGGFFKIANNRRYHWFLTR